MRNIDPNGEDAIGFLVGLGQGAWYEHKYWTRSENGEDIPVEKGRGLEKLYNNPAGCIRRHCDRLKNGNYIGPKAKMVHNRGAKLSK